MCNQNRVHCGKLEEAKDFCKKIENMTLLERSHHMMNASHGHWLTETEKTIADYTICNKMSVSDAYINTSIVEYLFEQGKCGDICKKGKIYKLQQHICSISTFIKHL